jgi:hypothetical protein
VDAIKPRPVVASSAAGTDVEIRVVLRFHARDQRSRLYGLRFRNGTEPVRYNRLRRFAGNNDHKKDPAIRSTALDWQDGGEPAAESGRQVEMKPWGGCLQEKAGYPTRTSRTHATRRRTDSRDRSAVSGKRTSKGSLGNRVFRGYGPRGCGDLGGSRRVVSPHALDRNENRTHKRGRDARSNPPTGG